MPENVFKVGDEVISKAGGQVMVVEEVPDEEDMVSCRWHLVDGKVERDVFHVDTLKRPQREGLL